MKIKEVYEYLEAVEKINSMINNKIAEQEQILAVAKSTTQNIDGMPRASGTSDKVGNAVVKLIMYQNEIDSDIDFFYDLKCEIIRNIEKLETTQYDILHRYYIQGQSLGTIADCYAEKKNKKYFSRQAIGKIKKQGVEALRDIMTDSELYDRYKRNMYSKVDKS